MLNDPKTRQWTQLIVLTLAHGVLDLSPGVMHSALPAIQQEYEMSLTLPWGTTLGAVALGSILLGVFNCFLNCF